MFYLFEDFFFSSLVMIPKVSVGGGAVGLRKEQSSEEV